MICPLRHHYQMTLISKAYNSSKQFKKTHFETRFLDAFSARLSVMPAELWHRNSREIFRQTILICVLTWSVEVH